MDMDAEINKAVEAALAKLLNGKTPKPHYKAKKRGFAARKAATAEEIEARKAANDVQCRAVFEAAGYKNVVPRVNVLTFDKWIENGRRVRRGEKGLVVGPFRLFHELQTDPITEPIPGRPDNVIKIEPMLPNEPVTPPTDKKVHWSTWNE